jgi:flagellar protein FliO/FliZ
MDTLLDPRFFIIFPVALVVTVGGFWLIRRLFGTPLRTAMTRRRQPRLGVIDAAAVDERRRLMLIRHDNVEHLLMIGGPRDIVVEPCIVRAVPVISQRDVPGVRGAQPSRSGCTLTGTGTAAQRRSATMEVAAGSAPATSAGTNASRSESERLSPCRGAPCAAPT